MMRPSLLLLILLIPIALQASTALRNELAGNPSPYLAMHGDDPVHWQSWGPRAIEAARQGNKLMLISSGYFSCYWCHVMQQESYQNKEIAAFLNEAYVPIKIDRELDPVLDTHLMDFIKETRGQAGWPLNIFMTPEGNALVGVLYMPPEQFRDLLLRLDARWRKEQQRLKKMATEAARILAQKRQAEQRLGEIVELAELEQAFLSQSLLQADEMAGGFGQQAKFPSAPQISALLTLYRKYPERRLRDFLLLTLEQIAAKGLRDQLGGGFFRYTTDPSWKTPHFEKMLYDNALMAEVYLVAGDVFSRTDFERLGLDTVDFILREMSTESGAFIAAHSAVDERGREGVYYLWGLDDLSKLLNREEFRVVQLAWGLAESSDWESGYLPSLVVSTDEIATSVGINLKAVEETLVAVKQKLLAIRQQRHLPKDNKRLTSWNGLVLATLAQGAQRHRSRYAPAAKKLYDFIITTLWDNKGLQRAVDKNGQSLGPGILEDYAYIARGLFAWARYSGEQKDYDFTAEVVASAWRRFYSVQGWRMIESGFIPYQNAQHHIADSPLPSPSATLLHVSLELIDHPLLILYREQIANNLKWASRGLTSKPFAHATHVAVLSRYAENGMR